VVIDQVDSPPAPSGYGVAAFTRFASWWSDLACL